MMKTMSGWMDVNYVFKEARSGLRMEEQMEGGGNLGDNGRLR